MAQLNDSDLFDTDGMNADVLPHETFAEDLEELSRALKVYGVDPGTSRISRYLKALEISPNDENGFRSIFPNSIDSRFNSSIDFYVYLMYEIHEIQFVVKGIKTGNIRGFEKKLQKIMKGSDFSHENKNQEYRSIQFEFIIASYFAIDGYSVDMSNETDLIATVGWKTFYVECKRIVSQNKLISRLSEATKQLNARLPKQQWRRRYYGLIFLDVSHFIVANGGLIGGFTVEQPRETLRNRLDQISQTIKNSYWSGLTGQNILLSIHCVVPMVTLMPKSAFAFSTHKQIFTDDLSLRNVIAISQVWMALRSPNLRDHRASKKKPVPLQTDFSVPKGTMFEFNEDVLEYYVDNKEIPDTDPDTIILNVTYPDGKTEDFVYMIWLWSSPI